MNEYPKDLKHIEASEIQNLIDQAFIIHNIDKKAQHNLITSLFKKGFVSSKLPFQHLEKVSLRKEALLDELILRYRGALPPNCTLSSVAEFLGLPKVALYSHFSNMKNLTECFIRRGIYKKNYRCIAEAVIRGFPEAQNIDPTVKIAALESL